MVEEPGSKIRPDRVAIYIRWSTEEQGDGTTLIEQREGCEFYVRSQGWSVNPDLLFIDDGYSGASLDRPGMRQLRTLVANKDVDCVVVLKIDRLSRNIVDAVQLVLEEWKDACHLRCVRQPIDTTSETGRMFFSILATFADFERAQITERTYQGRIRRLREGRAYGGPAVPYGLLATGEPGVRVVDPVRGATVAELFRRVREDGTSVLDLVRWLEAEGTPPPEAERWSLNTVRRILRNPIYMGQIVYGRAALVKKPGRKTPHRQRRAEPTVVANATTVPAIVPAEVFAAVQLILDERAGFHRQHRRAAEGVHLLTGIARCRCGGTLNVHWARGVRHYICSKRITAGSSACPASGTVVADRVDRVVVADLLALFCAQERRSDAVQQFQSRNAVDIAGLERELSAVAADLERLDRRLAELRLSAGVGDLPLGDWRDLRAALEGKQQSLRVQYGGLEARRQKATCGINAERTLLERMARLDRWHALTAPEQKALLRDLAEQIEVFKPRGRCQPYAVTVTWRFNPHMATVP